MKQHKDVKDSGGKRMASGTQGQPTDAEACTGLAPLTRVITKALRADYGAPLREGRGYKRPIWRAVGTSRLPGEEEQWRGRGN